MTRRRDLEDLTKRLEEVLAAEEDLKGKLSETLMKSLERFSEKLQGVVSATDELLPSLAEELKDLINEVDARFEERSSPEAEKILEEIKKLIGEEES